CFDGRRLVGRAGTAGLALHVDGPVPRSASAWPTCQFGCWSGGGTICACNALRALAAGNQRLLRFNGVASNIEAQHFRRGLTMKGLMLVLWTVAAAVAGIGWTAAVEDDTEAAYKKELEIFTGTWQLVASEKDGVKAPEAEITDIKIIFKGDKFTMERAGKTVEEGWICIDPARKPKVIDVYP